MDRSLAIQLGILAAILIAFTLYRRMGQVSPAEARRRIEGGTLLDVRSPSEFLLRAIFRAPSMFPWVNSPRGSPPIARGRPTFPGIARWSYIAKAGCEAEWPCWSSRSSASRRRRIWGPWRAGRGPVRHSGDMNRLTAHCIAKTPRYNACVSACYPHRPRQAFAPIASDARLAPIASVGNWKRWLGYRLRSGRFFRLGGPEGRFW